jgi:predicted tellurium resistance membrane protein TerC
MDRFPVIITAGAMLLGWIAGTMAVTDPAVIGYLPSTPSDKAGVPAEVSTAVRYTAGIVGALIVMPRERLARPAPATEAAAAQGTIPRTSFLRSRARPRRVLPN